jgi:hypothetical protein
VYVEVILVTLRKFSGFEPMSFVVQSEHAICIC